MSIQFPEWDIPENIQDVVNEDGEWGSNYWHPVHLTVLGGIRYKNRDIPLCWQIEFDPSDSHFEEINEKLDTPKAKVDGYYH